MRVLAVLLTAVFVLAAAAHSAAQPPDRSKDNAAKAKALLILSTCNPSDSDLAKKAKSVLATSGLSHVIAPAPRPKKIDPPAKLDVSAAPDPDCPNGTCYPQLSGYTRGADGVYRPTGVAAPHARR